MSYWDYRIVRRVRNDETTFGIHEAFYEAEDGNTPSSITKLPVEVESDSPDGVAAQLGAMMASFMKPILEYEIIANAERRPREMVEDEPDTEDDDS